MFTRSGKLARLFERNCHAAIAAAGSLERREVGSSWRALELKRAAVVDPAAAARARERMHIDA
eukprot:78467-Pleurochrysis_carterae.AAC.1